MFFVCGGVGSKRWRGSQTKCQTRGLFLKREKARALTVIRVRTGQRLDTKQEPKYTEPNKTLVDTIRELKPLTRHR